MKKSKDGWIAAAGVLLMIVGAGLLGRIEPLAYVCIGLGAGLFGQGTGGWSPAGRCGTVRKSGNSWKLRRKMSATRPLPARPKAKPLT